MAAVSSYRDYQLEARDLVRSLIASSVEQVEREKSSIGVNVSWPTVDQLSPENGQSAIEEFIQSWQLDSSWLHHTSYNGIESQTGLHCYSVIFSQPSRRKPVPRATATVFFYIKPHNKQVMVFYVVEGQRVVLRPGQEVFREVWLKTTIKNKLTVTSSIQL